MHQQDSDDKIRFVKSLFKNIMCTHTFLISLYFCKKKPKTKPYYFQEQWKMATTFCFFLFGLGAVINKNKLAHRMYRPEILAKPY